MVMFVRGLGSEIVLNRGVISFSGPFKRLLFVRYFLPCSILHSNAAINSPYSSRSRYRKIMFLRCRPSIPLRFLFHIGSILVPCSPLSSLFLRTSSTSQLSPPWNSRNIFGTGKATNSLSSPRSGWRTFSRSVPLLFYRILPSIPLPSQPSLRRFLSLETFGSLAAEKQPRSWPRHALHNGGVTSGIRRRVNMSG